MERGGEGRPNGACRACPRCGHPVYTYARRVNETEQDRQDQAVRGAIARSIAERGLIPSIAAVAAALDVPLDVADASFRRLRDAHVFIPELETNEIYAYNPFCAGPTDFRVSTPGHEWWAICGWDALGVPAALGVRGTVHARCGDCGEPITVEVGSNGLARSVPDGVVFQTCVPARDAWMDIRFT